MNLVYYLDIYLFPLLLLTIIFLKMRKSSIQTTDIRTYGYMLLSTLALLVLDFMSRVLDGGSFSQAREVLWTINTAFFLLAPLVAFFWTNFICFSVYNKTISVMKTRRKLMAYVPMIVYDLLLLTNLKFHWVFYISEKPAYVRSTLYMIPYMLAAFYLIVGWIVLVISTRNEHLALRRRHFTVLCIFILAPMLAGIVQTLFFSLSLTIPCVSIAELLIYVQMQNEQITIDALTGMNNRGALDFFLINLSEQRDSDRSMCFFLLDLNHFKQINDTYGHAEGDRALKQTADILKQTFHTSNAFLARYGGDEFCIIETCRNKEDAYEVMDMIHKAFDKWNHKKNNPYELRASIGFAKIREGEYLSPKSIIEEADNMMYLNKRRSA